MTQAPPEHRSPAVPVSRCPNKDRGTAQTAPPKFMLPSGHIWHSEGVCSPNAYFSTTTHGNPCRFRASMNGSGSNCSMLNTPLPVHLPVTIIMAPIMAGTPVV